MDYLAENAVPIAALPDQPDGYARFGDYRVILIGENHGIQKTYEAEFSLLRYLNESLGIWHILLELGYCDAPIPGHRG